MRNKPKTIDILAVDDRPANLLALQSIITSPYHHLVQAESGIQALELLPNHDFALALIDVQMPGMNGFELAERIRKSENGRYIPIIFLTAGEHSEEIVNSGYNIGAVDFLIKPLNVEALRSKISFFTDFHQNSLAKTKALLQSERRLEQVFEKAPSFMSVTRGPHHIYERANAKYYELMGRGDEILGKKVAEVVPEVENQGFIQLLDEVYRNNVPYVGTEVSLELKQDGTEKFKRHFVDFAYLPLTNAHGEVTGIMGYGNDVTEKVLARLRAEEGEKKIRTFAEAMPQMAFIANDKGEIIYYNQQWYDYIGDIPGTLGWGWKDLAIHHPDDLQPAISAWTKAVETGNLYQIEYRLRRQDGEYRWHLGRAVAWRDEQGKIVRWYGTNTDIHEQKIFMGELQRALSMRDEFISIASHELKTPVTSLQLQIQMMEKRIEKSDGEVLNTDYLQRVADTSNRQIARLSRLIEDMLDVSRLSSGTLQLEFQKCDFVKLVQDVYTTSFAEQFRSKGIECRMQLPAYVPIECDSMRMEQVITNLLSNCLKYGEGKPVDISIHLTDKQAELKIQDYGLGIADEFIDRIFNRFERAIGATNISGLGLGLFISKQIIAAHHGDILVESVLGKGSCFKVILPISR